MAKEPEAEVEAAELPNDDIEPSARLIRHVTRIERCFGAIEKEKAKKEPDLKRIASFEAEIERRDGELKALGVKRDV